MITRPLDIASRLRPPPASFDGLFFVNGGLIVLFFYLFGSQFVLAPSLGVDFRLAEIAGANADAQPATHHLTVTDSGQIFGPDGGLTMEMLPGWLKAQFAVHMRSKNAAPAVLLLRASRGLPTQDCVRIAGFAREAGFMVRVALTEAPKGAAVSAGTGGR